MNQRCRAKTGTGWRDYASKGITVCERWQIFENFLDDMGERPPGMSLDRIDSKNGYFKENCRWASKEQQAQNRNLTRWFTIDGETRCMREWARIFGISYKLAHERIQSGWSPKEAFTKPRLKGPNKGK